MIERPLCRVDYDMPFAIFCCVTTNVFFFKETAENTLIKHDVYLHTYYVVMCSNTKSSHDTRYNSKKTRQ